MKINTRRRGVLALLFLLPLSTVAFAQSSGGKCDLPALEYQITGYVVRSVSIDTPLRWLSSVDSVVSGIVDTLPVKAGERYVKAKADAGFIQVKESFEDLKVSPNVRFAVRVAYPTLRNCDASSDPKLLDVVYKVYTVGGLSNYLSRAFESERREVGRSVASTKTTERLAQYFVQPYAGYNRSRNIYGGTRLTIQQPGGILDKITLEGAGSSSSSVAKAEAVGSHDPDEGTIGHTEWRASYQHSDLPGDEIDLRRETFSGQFFAATRARGDRAFVLRAGALVEGGSRRTDIAPALLGPGDVLDTDGGSVKLFAGGTSRLGRHALKASYGLQLGSAGGGLKLDYIKQVFDAAANLRFLPRNHRPLTLDAQFTAGTLHKRGLVPVAERFFGGNAEENFITGETWVIRANPFIRSFPQNRFNRISPSSPFGGDRFFSANITFAATVWGHPLVPEVVLEDPEFAGALEFALSGGEANLTNQLLAETAEFRAVAELIPPLQVLLTQAEGELNAIRQQTTDAGILAQAASAQTLLETARTTVNTIVKDLADDKAKTADIRKLVVGFPAVPIPSQLESLNSALNTLGGTAGVPANTLGQRVAALEQQRQLAATAFNTLMSSTAFTRAEKKAQDQIAFSRRVIDQLIREANLIGVSPVAIFDAARLWQNGVEGKTRYAVGGGLRISIVSFDITAGYAFNPNRQPNEGRGAFLFTMELSNLFR